MQTFNKRTKVPAASNNWFKSVNYGGYSNCTTDLPNPRAKGSTINNCIGYCWGRYFEAQAINGALFGTTDKARIREMFAERPKGDPDVAWIALTRSARWAPYCKQTPKRGAIAFYQKQAKGSSFNGHVSFVEDYKSLRSVDFSNNNLRTAPLFKFYDDVDPYGNFGKYDLLGYLWPIADFKGETYTTTDALNCRKKPGGEILGVFGKGAVVTIAGNHVDFGGTPYKYVRGKTLDGKTVSGYVSIKYLK